MSEMKKVYEKLHDTQNEMNSKINKIKREYEPKLNELKNALQTMEEVTGLKICDKCRGDGWRSKIDAAGDTERYDCNCSSGFVRV